MEVTDSGWLGVIVNDALIAHVDVAQILRSTWPRNTPGWRRYILSITSILAIGGNRGGLKDIR